ncbi:MAG TPA: c-type cytochrome domain-containing protein [Verrucomicrobiales bacterium]|nr:c-type cytochrome domain-containing protein [Verrucomicrobiales bacterium]
MKFPQTSLPPGGWSVLLRLKVPAILTLALSAAKAAPDRDASMAMRLLRGNCVSCHNEEKRKGGLALTTRDALMKGGEDGSVIAEGKPGESALIQSLSAAADPHMPPKKQLGAAQIKLLEEWVRAGAPWDAAAMAGEPSPPRPVALAPLPGEFRPVLAVALSPDGARLAVGCRNEVMLFDVSPKALAFRARASGHLDPVQSIAWTGDGRHLVTGAFRRVLIWDAESLTLRREILTGLTGRITAVRPLANSSQVLLADGQEAENGFVRILDMQTGQTVRSWRAHEDTIFAMDVSRDGNLLATAGGDKLVKLWDIAKGAETAKLEAHSTQVLSLAFNPDSTQLVSGGADRQLKVWDVKTKENTIALANRSAAFNAVTWSSAGPAVFAVTEDGTLLRYTDLKVHSGAQSSDPGNERQVGRSDAALYCLTATANGERLFAGSGNGRILGWDKEGKLLDNIDSAAIKSQAVVTPR